MSVTLTVFFRRHDKVLLKLGRRSRGHFVTLIESCVHLITSDFKLTLDISLQLHDAISHVNIDKLTTLNRIKTGRITALIQQEIAFLSYAALIYSI